MQSKDEIELAVFEAFRELLLAIRVFWLLLTVLLGKLLDGSPSITLASTAHTNKHTIKKRKILSLSSN